MTPDCRSSRHGWRIAICTSLPLQPLSTLSHVTRAARTAGGMAPPSGNTAQCRQRTKEWAGLTKRPAKTHWSSWEISRLLSLGRPRHRWGEISALGFSTIRYNQLLGDAVSAPKVITTDFARHTSLQNGMQAAKQQEFWFILMGQKDTKSASKNKEWIFTS